MGQPSSLFRVDSIDLVPDAITAKFTRGTGPQTITAKLIVSPLPVATNSVPTFPQTNGLSYQALLYELHDKITGAVSNVSPNWFGVAIPSPDSFDLSGDVYVIIYFHPTPSQPGARYSDLDYLTKTGAHGTDWKQLYAYVDRLGGQMAGAIQATAPANRITIFPFLKMPPYTVPTSEWFNIIHDILQDINTNVIPGVCTRPKKIIVAAISNGAVYLNKFLTDAAGDPANNSKIIEAWDFDSEVSQPREDVNPHGKRLRAYWQGTVPASTATKTYIHLPTASPNSWQNFPPSPPAERPPLPPAVPNSNPANTPDSSPGIKAHHYIRDTMFLDAVLNIEADNP